MQNSSAESGDTWWTVPAEGDGTPEVSLSLLCLLCHGHGPNALRSEGSENLEVVFGMSGGYCFSTAEAFTFATIPEILNSLSMCTHSIAFYF